MLKYILAAAALLATAAVARAADSAVVVNTCGTPPTTYTAGQSFAMTQDTTGKLCNNVSVTFSPSGTQAVSIASGAVASGAYASGSIASGAMVDLGAKADATCSTASGTCSLISLIKYLNTAFLFSNITTSTTTVVKSGAGVLHGINVNSLGTIASNVTVYDNTAGSGTKIATLDTLTAGNVGWNQYDAAFSTGLTIVTTGTLAPDISVMYK